MSIENKLIFIPILAWGILNYCYIFSNWKKERVYISFIALLPAILLSGSVLVFAKKGGLGSEYGSTSLTPAIKKLKELNQFCCNFYLLYKELRFVV